MVLIEMLSFLMPKSYLMDHGPSKTVMDQVKLSHGKTVRCKMVKKSRARLFHYIIVV